MGADMAALSKTNAGNPKQAQLTIWKKFQALAAHMPPVPASRASSIISSTWCKSPASITSVWAVTSTAFPSAPPASTTYPSYPFITQELLRRGFGARRHPEKSSAKTCSRVLSENEVSVPPSTH